MNTLKRIFCMTMVVFTLMSVFACSGSDGKEVFDYNLDDGRNSFKIDFEGQSMLILTGWDEEWKPEAGFTAMGDHLIARYKEIESKYNCKIDIFEGSDGFETFILTNVAASTDRIPDMVDCHASEIYGIYKMNMLFAYDDINTIDINDEKWGNKNFIRYGYFDGKQYGTFPYDWEFIPAILGVCMFDSTVLRQAGITKTPHEMLEDGTWTWQNFEPLLDLATYEDGDIKVTGLGYEDVTRISQTALFSNGCQIVEEIDGKNRFALTDSKAYETFDWLKGLKDRKLIYQTGYGDFNQHKMLFFVGESFNFTHMTQWHIDADTPVYKHDGYGFAPFPCGPNGEYGIGGSYITQGRRLNWLLKMGQMEKDDLGTLMNILFEPLDGTNRKAWIDFLESSVFYYREDDKNAFLSMVENVKYDWSSPLESAYSSITAAFSKIMNGSESAASALGAVEDKVNAQLDK
ncbi:MAG: hypothetical protein IJL30_09805 [Clostridia bacterium]|nr:hypothetical protein [Clostridia bacterium]